MRWLKKLLGIAGRDTRRESVAATWLANASRLRALDDLAQAREDGAEVAELVQCLRDHNDANRYDDWLTGIVRR